MENMLSYRPKYLLALLLMLLCVCGCAIGPDVRLPDDGQALAEKREQWKQGVKDDVKNVLTNTYPDILKNTGLKVLSLHTISGEQIDAPALVGFSKAVAVVEVGTGDKAGFIFRHPIGVRINEASEVFLNTVPMRLLLFERRQGNQLEQQMYLGSVIGFMSVDTLLSKWHNKTIEGATAYYLPDASGYRFTVPDCCKEQPEGLGEPVNI